MGLDGEVFEEQRVHRTLEANMKLVDLAFRQGEDGDAREAQAFEYPRHVLLIAADAVQRLGQHNVEAAGLCVGKQRLNARTDERCA